MSRARISQGEGRAKEYEVEILVERAGRAGDELIEFGRAGRY